jgi:uncharacterized protein YutE (UPF0331/DUF86 family)
LHGGSGREHLIDKSIVLRKIERIETYLKQLGQKRDPGVKAFSKDTDIQSIVLFNLIQAIQASIDIGAHIISDSEWGVPGSQADIFEILSEHKIIPKQLSGVMINMVDFRSRIVHEDEETDLRIVYDVWRKNSKDIEKFCKSVVTKYKI